MKKNLIKTALIAGGILMGSAMAHAGGVIGDNLNKPMGEVTVGETYQLTNRGEYYIYKPAASGAIVVQTDYNGQLAAICNTYGGSYNSYFFLSPSPAEPGAYADEYAAQKPEVADGGYQFIFFVNEGVQYLFAYTDDMYLDGPLGFSIAGNFEETINDVMIDCIPTPGTFFDHASGATDVVMEFEKALVSVESVALRYTDKQGQSQSIDIPMDYESGWKFEGQILDVKLGNTHNNEVYLQAKENADTSKPFYLDVTKAMCATGPVASANFKAGQEYIEFSGDGSFSIEYVFADNVNLISAKFPDTFYSYWAPGTEAGMAVLTFDGPVNPASANMTVNMGTQILGSPSSGDEPDPYWNIDYTLNDDKTVLTLNFTGINYSEALTKNYNTVTVIIYGINGENGMTAILEDNNGYNSLAEVIPFVDSPYGDAELPGIIEGTPTVDPANNSIMRELQPVVVTWDEPVSLVPGMATEANVQLGNVGTQRIPLVVEDGALIIDLTKLTLPDGRFTGTCFVTVPSGVVADKNNDINDTLNLIYTMAISSSGVNGIEAENGPVEIYNLNGVKVDAKQLNPGIYVINGKKVVVK